MIEMLGSWLREGDLTPCKQLYLSRYWRDAVKPHISPELGPVFTPWGSMKTPCFIVRASMQS